MQHATRSIVLPRVIHNEDFYGCVRCNYVLVPMILEDDACNGLSLTHLGSTISVNVTKSRITRRGISSTFTNRFTSEHKMLEAMRGV